MSKKPLPQDYETFDVTDAPCIAIRERDLRAGGWIREKDAANVLSEENVELRTVLGKLLGLDAKRPAGTTFWKWKKWWDEAVAEATAILGGFTAKAQAPDEARKGTIGEGMSDQELLAQYVELERFAETNGESWADGFARVQFKKAVLARMPERGSAP
jgi:hypothetical protein